MCVTRYSMLRQDAEHYTGVDNRTQIYCNDFLSNAELLGLFVSEACLNFTRGWKKKVI